MKKKILFVITDTGIGGAEKELNTLISEIRDEYDCTVVSLKKEGYAARELKKQNVKLYSLNMSKTGRLKNVLTAPIAVLRLLFIFLKEKPDLIYSSLFMADILSAVVCIPIRKPLIASLQVAEREKSWQWLIRKIFDFTVTEYVAVSKAVADFYSEKAAIEKSKFTVIPNSVNAENYRDSSKKEGLKKELGIDKEAFVIMSIGRLHRQKGLEYGLKAFKQIKKDHLNVRYVIVGKGPESDRLRRIAERLDISSYVLFTGERKDVPDLLSLADVVLHPSRWEGMPNVVLEAMASATPVVASDVDGTREIIDNGKDGFLVETGEVNEMANIISKLIKSSTLLQNIASAGRTKVEKQFSTDSFVSAHRRVFERHLK